MNLFEKKHSPFFTFFPLRVLVLALVLVALATACTSDSTGPTLTSGDVAPVSDGGEIDPTIGGEVSTCTLDTDGSCLDATENTDLVNISNTGLDFGLNELNAIECIDITIPGGLKYEAEIDKDNTDAVDGNYQFAVLDASGNPSQSRVEGSGNLSLCYLRDATGTHKGQIRVVVNADSSASSAYATVITTTGETMDTVFTIVSPTPNQIIDARSDHHNGDGITSEGDYLITASGSVNLNLSSIFINGTSADIVIQADTVKYKTNFDGSGNFSKEIGLPSTAGVYDVTFSIDTNKQEPITKTIPVVVAGAPKLEIEVRDASGALVNESTTSDAQNLIIGLKVTNLMSSGSSSSDMPVTLSDIQWNGTPFASDKEIYYEDGYSWCADVDGTNYSNFDSEITYCIPASVMFESTDLTTLQNGSNTISAKASNVLGEGTDQFILIVDNTKPSIDITSPKNNSVVAPNSQTVLIEGTVKNYAPVDVNNTSSIPTGGDGGSYCQPQSNEDTGCPSSNVKLWLNLPTLSTTLPIQIYPNDGRDTSTTLREYNDALESDPTTSANCSTTIDAQTIFSGDPVNTTTDSSGNIVTTITADDTSTTTYTTTTDGVVTVSHPDGTQDVYTSSDDPSTDVTVTVVTDGVTGEITNTRTQTLCNIPEGTFSFTVTLPLSNSIADLNLFTNVLEFQATSVSGHNTIKTVTFQRGYLKQHGSSGSFRSITSTINSAWMGLIDSTCETGDDKCISRAPVQLHIANGLIDKNETQGAIIIKVVEDYLNENVSFADIANGWMFMPEDDNGNPDLEADFQRQVEGGYSNFVDLSDSEKEKFIQQGLHSNVMALKYWAKIRYIEYMRAKGDEQCLDNSSLCLFKRTGDPEDFNVALDSEGSVITTTMVPLGDLQYVSEHLDWFDSNDWPGEPEWPDFTDDLNYNSFVDEEGRAYGRWVIQSLTIQDDGGIDADICLMPDDPQFYEAYEGTDETSGCGTDVSAATVPAFWGHAVSYNLVEGGATGRYNTDPFMPIVWSVGKVRLKLENVIHLIRDNQTNSWSNKIEIDRDTMSIMELSVADHGNMHDEDKMKASSIQIEPFNNCPDFYAEHYNGEIPFGCEKNDANNYPLTLELNSEQGQTIYQTTMAGGQSAYMLEVMWQQVIETFKKLIGSLDTEMVNPAISDAYKFPVWAMNTDRIQSSFEWNTLSGSTSIKNLEIGLDNNGITLRVPLQIGASGVMNTVQSFMSSSSAVGSGHVVRTQDTNDLPNSYPILPEHSTDAFLSTSINIEELFNAAMHILFKKGPFTFLDELGIDDIQPTTNWSVGVDKVILNRFDICGLAGDMLPSSLPSSMIFPNVQSLFSQPSLHLDIILDPNNAPTLSLNNIDGTTNATEIQIGITNIQIAAKELIPATGEDENGDIYNDPTSQPEILRVRLDGVITLQVVYDESSQVLKVYIPDITKQNLHFSVPAGHGGATYNDADVVAGLYDLVKTTLSYIAKDYAPLSSTDDGSGAEASSEPSLTIDLSSSGDGQLSLRNLNNFLKNNITMPAFPANVACNGQVATYAGGDSTDDTSSGSGYHFDPGSVVAHPLDQPSDLVWNSCTFVTALNNPIAEALCDFGMRDIKLSPTIAFDNENGYLHLSGTVGIELLDE